MITLLTDITGNAQLTTVENEDRSGLVPFLRIPRSHCTTGCTSSFGGQNPTKRFTEMERKSVSERQPV